MSNADWWAKKLGTPQPQAPVGRPSNIPPMPPSQTPMQGFPTFQPASAASPQTSLAQSARQTATCPDCGSGNYMAPSPQIAPRCIDCGYPIAQSGSRYGALTGAHVEGSAKQASGNSSTSGFNPMPPGYGPDGRKL